MPRPDLVRPLAQQLSRLRHPNGTEMRFLHHSTFAHGDKAAAHIQALGERTIEAFINEIELLGGTIHMPNDPVPVDAIDKPGHKTAKIVCSHCATHLGELLVNPDMTVTLNSVAQKALAKLPTNCDDHKRLTNGG